MIIHFGLVLFCFFSLGFPCIHYIIRSHWVRLRIRFGFSCVLVEPCDELVWWPTKWWTLVQRTDTFWVGTKSTCMHMAHVALEVAGFLNLFFIFQGLFFALCLLVGLWSHFSNLASSSSPNHFKKRVLSVGILDILPLKGICSEMSV